jgi:hypothetical protein
VEKSKGTRKMDNLLERQYISNLEEIYAQPKYQGIAKVGRLERISPAGDVYVDFVGNDRGPIHARITLSGEEMSRLRYYQRGAPLLLIFDDGILTAPIVVGFVDDRLPSLKSQRRDVVIDGAEVAIEGQEQVVLRCGKSSISLNKSGKIILKGIDLVSRAIRGNRIRGGTVKIN